MSDSHMGKHTSPKTEFKPGYIGYSKLNWQNVEEIREKCIKNGHSRKQVAQEYGVSTVTIGLIVRNKIWICQKSGNNEI